MNKKILILVEGENTEVRYFQSFKRIEQYRRNLAGLDIEVYKPKDHSPKGLLEEAKLKQTIENAKWLEKLKENDLQNVQLHEINPYTTVHKLVEYIYNIAIRDK